MLKVIRSRDTSPDGRRGGGQGGRGGQRVERGDGARGWQWELRGWRGATRTRAPELLAHLRKTICLKCLLSSCGSYSCYSFSVGVISCIWISLNQPHAILEENRPNKSLTLIMSTCCQF